MVKPKLIKIFEISCFLILMIVSSILTVSASGTVVGTVEKTDISAYINGYKIPAYSVNGSLVVVVSDLNSYGLHTSYDNHQRLSTITLNPATAQFNASGNVLETRDAKVYSSDIKVQAAGTIVDGFNIDGKMAVKFSDLKLFGNYNYNNDKRISTLMIEGLSVKKDSRIFDDSKVISSGKGIIKPEHVTLNELYDFYNIYYELRENGTLYVYGSGSMPVYTIGESENYSVIGLTPVEERPWAAHKDKVKKLVIEEGITDTGCKSFADMTSLETVVLPNSLTKIEEKVFQRCTSLSNIILPTTTAEIGDDAFQACTSLKSIVIPENCNKIGSMAFYYCPNLTNVQILSSPEQLSMATFCSCGLSSIIIPDSVQYLGDKVFSSSGKHITSPLKNIYFMGDFPDIGINSFWGAENLTLYHLKGAKGWNELGSQWTDSDGTVCNIRTFEIASDGSIIVP